MGDKVSWLPRFSIRTLLLLIALTCVALATTVSASEQVLRGIWLVWALSMPVGVLLAIYLRGTWRAFWIGFCVFGLWSYLFLFTELFPGHIVWNPLRSFHDHSIAPAITTIHRVSIDAKVQELIRRRYIDKNLPQDFLKDVIASKSPEITTEVQSHVFEQAYRIAQHHFQLAIAILGGFLACWLHQLRERHTPPHGDTSVESTA